jgi:hypothetical protein
MLSSIALIACTLAGWATVRTLESAGLRAGEAHIILFARSALEAMARAIAPGHLDPQPELIIRDASLVVHWSKGGEKMAASARLVGGRLLVEVPGASYDIAGVRSLSFEALRGEEGRIHGFSAVLGCTKRETLLKGDRGGQRLLAFAFSSISPSKGAS